MCNTVCMYKSFQLSRSDYFWHVVRVRGLECDIRDKAAFLKVLLLISGKKKSQMKCFKHYWNLKESAFGSCLFK